MPIRTRTDVRDWIQSHPLRSDDDVQPFVAAARTLTLEDVQVMAVTYRDITEDERQIATAALRARGGGVFVAPEIGRPMIVLPAARVGLLARVRRRQVSFESGEGKTWTLASLLEAPGPPPIPPKLFRKSVEKSRTWRR